MAWKLNVHPDTVLKRFRHLKEKGLIYNIVKEFKARIADKYELHEMRIFGSSARGDRGSDSDIDVFVHISQVSRQIEENLFDIAYELVGFFQP